MTEIVNHDQAEPIQVVGCPSSHKGKITIVSVKIEHPEPLYLYPGIATRMDGHLVGWYLSCGCFLSGKRFELHVNPLQEGYLPRFVRRQERDG